MPLVAKAERLAAMERYGLSPRLREIARNVSIPAALVHSFEPVGKVYDDEEYIDEYSPEGFVTLPLWELDTRVTAVRQEPDGLTFFSYNLEDRPYEVTILARTEQGLWAHIFVFLIELERKNLPALAQNLGFRYLPLLEERYRSAPHETFEQHDAFLAALTSEIDALEGTVLPG